MVSSRMNIRVAFRFRSCFYCCMLFCSLPIRGMNNLEKSSAVRSQLFVLRANICSNHFSPALFPYESTNPPFHLFKCLLDRHRLLHIRFLPCLLFSFLSFLSSSLPALVSCLLAPLRSSPRRAFESLPLRLILPLFPSNTKHSLSGPYLHTRPGCCLMVNNPSHDPLSSRLLDHNGDSISQAQGTQRRASLLSSSQQGSQPYPPPALTDSNHYHDGSLYTGREASSFSRAPTIRPLSSRYQQHQVDNDDISNNNVDGDDNNEDDDDYEDEDGDDAVSAMQPILQTKTVEIGRASCRERVL